LTSFTSSNSDPHLEQQRSKHDNEHDDEHEHDLGTKPSTTILVCPSSAVLVIVLVIDSQDFSKASVVGMVLCPQAEGSLGFRRRFKI